MLALSEMIVVFVLDEKISLGVKIIFGYGGKKC